VCVIIYALYRSIAHKKYSYVDSYKQQAENETSENLEDKADENK
ncbi:sugar ABC transporter permease, partial [Staphylococcus saprophyticus]